MTDNRSFMTKNIRLVTPYDRTNALNTSNNITSHHISELPSNTSTVGSCHSQSWGVNEISLCPNFVGVC